jgi:ribose/xylose/arabinose/galactoside ABC-type transport system permease subunit
MENETLDNLGANGSGISTKAKADLKSAYSWVMVIAILGFIAGGLMALFGIFALVASVVSGLITIAMAAVYIYMAMLLLKQANAVKNDTPDMETFASSYLMYWKIIVILLILSVLFVIISYFTVASQVSSVPNQFPF